MGEGMEYRVLGGTGVKVSSLCLGAMMFGWGNKDEADCIRIIHRALDEGINFVDTADAYSMGISEQIVGKALKGRRDDVFLATKFNRAMYDNVLAGGNSRRWIHREVEDSLRRLGTDWIDLYQAHRPDPDTDIEETLGALDELVTAGKVRYIGTSKFPAHSIVEAQWSAARNGSVRFTTEQPPYSMLVRGIEADVLPVCERYRMGTLVWGPLLGGWLTGKYRKGVSQPESSRWQRIQTKYDLSRPENQIKLEKTEALALLAEEVGISLVHLAIRFVLAHPGVTSAIIGPRTMEHLEDYLGAPDAPLDGATLDRIDAIVPPGVIVDPLDLSIVSPATSDPSLRRR
jgi:aryl-alcohol dehydrogenase-like predicted oxidoreductase